MIEFLASKVKNKKPFFEKNAIQELYSWKELECLLNLRPFINDKRFHVLTEGEFKWPCQAWLSDMNTYPPSIVQEMIKKHSCYISDASRISSNVNKLCSELEKILQYPTDAHVYFAAADNCSQGFPIHWDWSHNLIVQVEGSTNIKVWDIVAETNSNRLIDSLDKKPILDVMMTPGDVIFVPERYYHQAISLTKRLSISFPSNPHEKLQPQERLWIKT